MSLQFSVEPLPNVWNEVLAMGARHWQETMEWERTRQIYNPKFERYNLYANIDALLVFVARDEGVMVGYGLMYLTPSMHTQSPITTEDTIFLLPPYRKGRNGLRFYEFVEWEMARRGAVDAFVTAKPGSAASRLLEHMGYTHLNNQYGKHLGADSAQSHDGAVGVPESSKAA